MGERTSPITFVRHSMAVSDASRHPTEWELDAAGRAAAHELAGRLEVAPAIGALVSSTEPKALGTAEVIAARWDVEVVPDDRLREASRAWVGPGYRGVAHRYLRGQPIEDWEPHDDVAARAAAAVDDAVAAAEGDPVVVVSHGLVLAVHLRAALGAEFDAESFWSCLAFPDAWALDGDGLLHRPLGDALAAPRPEEAPVTTAVPRALSAPLNRRSRGRALGRPADRPGRRGPRRGA